MFKMLDETMSVSGQLTPAEIKAAAAQGFKLIINNRPDDEEAGQPLSADLERLAKSLDLGYTYIPVTHAGFSQLQIDQMVIALSRAHGPALGFCRTGTRSTLLWALAQAKLSVPHAELEAKAEAAGYSLAPIRMMLDMVTPRA